MNFFYETNADLINRPESLSTSSLMGMMKSFDLTTYIHSINVSNLATKLGHTLQLPEETQKKLSIAGLLHDVGKLSIPTEVLNKQSSLSSAEYKLIQSHSLESIKHLDKLAFSKDILTMITQHHEREDGSGYPYGLNSDHIMFESKILIVADVYDAMSSKRPYKPPIIDSDIIHFFKSKKGILFEGIVVEALLDYLHETLD